MATIAKNIVLNDGERKFSSAKKGKNTVKVHLTLALPLSPSAKWKKKEENNKTKEARLPINSRGRPFKQIHSGESKETQKRELLSRSFYSRCLRFEDFFLFFCFLKVRAREILYAHACAPALP